MNKIKVAIGGIHFPLSMMSYYIRAFRRREDVDLWLFGPFSGTYIPWNSGMHINSKYVVTPDFALPQSSIGTNPPAAIIDTQMPWTPDLTILIDAGWHTKDRPRGNIVAHVQTDPHCVAGDTMLFTDKGFLFANEAASSSIHSVASKNSVVSCGGAMFSGWKHTRKITVENGYELVCTDDHLVETELGMVRADKIKLGDRLVLSRGINNFPIGTEQDYSVGFIVGAFQGDGSFGSSDIIKFTIGKERKQEFGEAILAHASNGFGIEVVTEGKHYTCDNAKILQIRRWGLHRLLKSLDLKAGHVPYFIRTGNRQMFAGYLSGLLAADGCSSNGKIQITTKWRTLAKEIQSMLLHFGVVSRLYLITSTESSYKPGQRYATLYINSGESTASLQELVGTIPGKLMISGLNSRKEDSGTIQLFSVTSIEGAVSNYPHLRVSEPVYDVYNSETSTFLANGFSVHNCLKQTYQAPKAYSDLNFCMQKVYMEYDEIYLPYAYDPTVHYPMPEVTKEYDACLIGLNYDKRASLIRGLQSHNLRIKSGIGLVFDEYRMAYNQSKVALSWSSLLDIPARVFEGMAMGLPLVANRLPDMPLFFEEGVDYLGFDTEQEAIKQVLHLLVDDEYSKKIATNGYNKVKEHTWDARVQTILEHAKLI